MRPTREEIFQYILTTLRDLARDWDETLEVGPDTKLFTELGMESLDAVVLGTALQEHYQRQMPFAELLAQIGQEQRDLTVSELVDFIEQNTPASAGGAQ